MGLKIVFIILLQVLSIVFQIVSFSSPGWNVQYLNNGQTVMGGLFYQRICSAQGDCEIKTNLDLLPPNNPIVRKEWIYDNVASAFKGGLSIIFSAVVLALYVQTVRNNRWWMIFYLFCAVLSIVSGVLQWILMAPIANMNVIDQAENGEINIQRMGVPWCIVLYSFTAFHSSISFVVYMHFLIKEIFHIARHERTI